MERVVPAQERAPTGQAAATRERTALLPRSDELLARLVAAGGERPFRALYERYQVQLYRYCHSIVRNEADAQDALQSTFTRALIALRDGRRNAPLRPWLYRIAHNESISLLRASRSPTLLLEREPLPAHGPSAAERADERERLSLLLADLSQLPERARAALVMREMGGLSHDEIATALAISTGAAKQAIFEARGALLELAEGRAMVCDDVRRKLSDHDRRVTRGRRLRAHLRDCASCSLFATGVAARQADLKALTPALPPAAAAAVLARALQGAGGHYGGAAGATLGAGATSASAGGSPAAVGSGAFGAGASSGAATAAKLLAAVITPKALLATALVAGVAAGAGGLATTSSSGGSAPLRDLAGIRPRGLSVSATPGVSTHAHGRRGDRATAGARARGTRSGSAAAARHKPAHRPPPWVPGKTHGPRLGGGAPGRSGAATSRSGVPPGHARRGKGSRPGLGRGRRGPPPGATKGHGHRR